MGCLTRLNGVVHVGVVHVVAVAILVFGSLVGSTSPAEASGAPVTSLPATGVQAGPAGAGGMQPAAVSAAAGWPAACSASGALTGWVAVSRRAACEHIQFGITVTQYPSGRVIGTAELRAVNTLTASTGMARWSATTALSVVGHTGVGLPASVSGQLRAAACRGCVTTGGTWTQAAGSAGWRGTGNVDVRGIAPGGVVRNVGGSWRITLRGRGWGNDVVVEYGLATSRCDNNFTSGKLPPGCVFGNVAGVVAFSQSRLPQFVAHLYAAQLSGLPGRLGTATYLTRLTDATSIARNGAKACPAAMTPPAAGYDCDEYPFRSTHQGASTSGAPHARSLPWCRMPDPPRTGRSGWSRCFVSSAQTRSGTATLAAFYSAQRMLDGDPFEVGYVS